jgi:polysaccharide deacetylase family protein (PEP-CTERM system associated)
MDIAPPAPHAFTVDLEDWFQGLTSTNAHPEDWPRYQSRVEPMTRTILDLLEASGVKATFFTLGHVADHHPALVAEVAARGHEVAVHGYWHRFVNRLNRDEFGAELDRGIEALVRATGRTPQGHRAPYFSIDARTPWALDVLAERGLRYDSSFHPTRTMLYGYPGAKRAPHRQGPVTEFPVSTVRVAGQNLPFAGGFYMRSWPYALVRWAVRRVEREGLPVIFYVHPWELDLEQPRPRVTPRERVTHYHGRGGLRWKLRQLFRDFRFGPLSGLLERSELDRSVDRS